MTRTFFLPLFGVLLLGCPAETLPTPSDDPGPEELEITGSWTDDFGGTHDITEETWTMAVGGVFHILDYDNVAGVVIAENDAANEFNPGAFSRMDWTWDAADLYFCQTAYDAATEQAARDTPAADAADLATGCGGFGWSGLQ